MPITDDIKKTLTDPTPLYALAGAGDLAYEKLREVPGRVEALAADRKATQDKAVARLHEAQSRLAGAQAKVTESVSTLPTDLKALQEKAQGFALHQVGRAAEFAVKAKEVYDELAERGKAVVEKNAGEKSGENGGVKHSAEITEETKAEAVAEGAVKAPQAAAQPEAVAEAIETIDAEIVLDDAEAESAATVTPVTDAARARKAARPRKSTSK